MSREWSFPENERQKDTTRNLLPTSAPDTLYGEFLEEQRERRWKPFVEMFNKAFKLFDPLRRAISEDWERDYRRAVCCDCGIPRETCVNHKSPKQSYFP